MTRVNREGVEYVPPELRVKKDVKVVVFGRSSVAVKFVVFLMVSVIAFVLLRFAFGVSYVQVFVVLFVAWLFLSFVKYVG